MRSKYQAGFSGVELLIIVVILGVLGLLGFMAYNAYKKQPVAANTITTTTSSSSMTDNGANTATPNGVGPAEEATNNFYQAYLATTAGRKNAVSTYGTANFVNAYSVTAGSDPVLCGSATQTVANTQFTVSASTTTGMGYDAVVVLTFNNAPYSVLVSLVKDGSDVKVNKVTCPHP